MLTIADMHGISIVQPFSPVTDRPLATSQPSLQMDVWCWLLLVLVHFTTGSHDVVVTLNTLRPVTQLSDHFLGLSISPRHILNLNEYSVSTVNMLRALSPGFLRVGGSESNNLAFNSPTNTSAAYSFSESQWSKINQLAADTGLKLIFSLSTRSQKGQSQLLKYSDSKAYDVTWQLGYCTKNNGTNAEVESKEFIQEINNMLRLIDSFPRYRNTATLSPDLEFCEESKCLMAHKDLLLQSNDGVDIIVLQLKHEESLKNMKNMFGKLEKLTNEIEAMYFSRESVLPKEKDSYKNNIWLAESEDTDLSRGLLTTALTLGTTSRLGYHTLLMNLEHLSEPSHGYWAALLWRALVGRTVLGARVWPQDAEVAVFAACTETRPQPTIDLEWEYDPGAVTVWGVNTGEESVAVTIAVGSQLDHVHVYTLTDADQGIGNTLMNGRPLRLVHGVLPRLYPRVRSLSRTKSVIVPSKSVFFIVLPNAQIPICRSNSDEKLAAPLKKDESFLSLSSPLDFSKISSVSGNVGVKQGDILFEKGGVFTDKSEIESSLDKGNGAGTRNNIKEMIEDLLNSEDKYFKAKVDQNVKTSYANKDLNNFNSFSESIAEQQEQSLSKNNLNNNLKPSIEDISENPKNLELLNILMRNQKNNNTQSLTLDNIKESLQLSSNTSKSMENNKTLSLNETLETEVPRVKRSEYFDYYRQPEFTDTETFPLYRRVNLLRRILNKLQQTTQFENEEQNKNFGSVNRDDGKYENKSRKTIAHHTGSLERVNTRMNKYVEKDQRSLRVMNNSDEKIKYFPGEFYEVLGDLKLDSNVSLKNKEEIIEATNSLPSRSEQNSCNNIKSKLTVLKKPENNPEEDKRLVEQATENLKHLYMLRNNTELKEKQTSQVESYEKTVDNEGTKMPAIISTEDMSVDLEEKENYGKFVSTEVPLERTKRDIYQGDLDETLKHKDNKEDNEKNEYQDEVEMSRFLEELTNEGEQLLQAIDEDYELNPENSNNTASNQQIFHTRSLPNLDEKSSIIIVGDDLFNENKKEESDFYLKNNILTDKDIKPKLKYSAADEQIFDYNMVDKPNDPVMINNVADKNQFSTTNLSSFGSEKSEVDSSTNEPSLITEITISSDITSPKKNISDKSITEAINNSDMYIESIIPQSDKTTKPGINFTEENSKVRKISTKIENNFLTDNIKNNHEVKSGELNVSTLVTKESDTSVTTEYSIDKKKMFDGKGFKQDSTNKSVDLSQNSEIAEKIDGNSTQMMLSDKQIKPISIIPSIFDVKVPHTIIRNIPDGTRKIDSESKLENKILPPPPKPLLSSRTLSVPSTQNLGLHKKVDTINKKVAEFQNKPQLAVPVLQKSLKINTPFSDRYKERLEAIKQKLQKAREQILNETNTRIARLKLSSNNLKPKREIISNKDILRSLINKDGIQGKIHILNSTTERHVISLNKSLSLENLPIVHRLKRQVYELNDRETVSSLENRSSIDEPVDVETKSDSNVQPSSNILIPFYFPALKKWVIPLSNRTENIMYKSNMVPVNLYGIISDKWIQKYVDKSSDNSKVRRRRGLRYPCVRDKYNDFEAEDESNTLPWNSNVEVGGQDSTSKIVKDQADSVRRTRRTISKDIEMNELEMKALLTNEIVKDKSSNDLPNHENVFSSMLQRTLSKSKANKTGIERMLELAKQYQETNPSSVEIFSTKKKIKTQNLSGEKDEIDGENISSEITQTENNYKSSPKVIFGQTEKYGITERKNNTGGYGVEKVRIDESTESVDRIGNNKTSQTDNKEQDDLWSFVVTNIQDFFESIATEVKKSIM